MSQILKIRKVNTLPVTYEASTLYLVKGSVNGLFEMHLSTDDGATVRRLPTDADIVSKINAAISSFASIEVVANIAARNAIVPTTVKQVLVLDATGDATVASGAATYIYNVGASTWVKISEAESMDVVLQWANIQGKPSSAVADIDDAVTKRHSHANKAVLDNFSVVSGDVYYSGQPIRSYLDAVEW